MTNIQDLQNITYGQDRHVCALQTAWPGPLALDGRRPRTVARAN
ncbi:MULTISPECIES: hypothetical protein [Dinoroseobacter]|jgi:hypothetical protein|nr:MULTISPECIES: hypothetical protein [Dinoroseobacter]MDD9717364.1 hypothetical protein [Dinoroseobacter sp. PD6]